MDEKKKNALIKNLGLSSDSDDSDDPFAITVRPKNAGVSAEIGNPQKNENLFLSPTGSWMIGRDQTPCNLDPNKIGDEEHFCTVPICVNFQKSLVRFHKSANSASINRSMLENNVSNTKEKIKILKFQLSHSSEKEKNIEKLHELIINMSEESFDFDAAIECCRIIAKDPSIIDSEDKKKHYTKKGSILKKTALTQRRLLSLS